MTDVPILLRRFDAIPVTCAVVELYLPADEVWTLRGIAYVTPDLGARLGPPNDALAIGTHAFPAWSAPVALDDIPGPPPASPADHDTLALGPALTGARLSCDAAVVGSRGTMAAASELAPVEGDRERGVEASAEGASLPKICATSRNL